ncbi:hypothetical protein O3G_MSEX000608 [Manduca sexta]|nr:hypothetical protein O3G_MSEX000608 [Manduca sexta]
MRLHRCEGCLAACGRERRAATLLTAPARPLHRTKLLKRARRAPYSPNAMNKENCVSKMAEPSPPTPPDNDAPRMSTLT